MSHLLSWFFRMILSNEKVDLLETYDDWLLMNIKRQNCTIGSSGIKLYSSICVLSWYYYLFLLQYCYKAGIIPTKLGVNMRLDGVLHAIITGGTLCTRAHGFLHLLHNKRPFYRVADSSGKWEMSESDCYLKKSSDQRAIAQQNQVSHEQKHRSRVGEWSEPLSHQQHGW